VVCRSELLPSFVSQCKEISKECKEQRQNSGCGHNVQVNYKLMVGGFWHQICSSGISCLAEDKKWLRHAFDAVWL